MLSLDKLRWLLPVVSCLLMRDGCTDDGGVLFGVESISSYCDFTLCDRVSSFMTASLLVQLHAKLVERPT